MCSLIHCLCTFTEISLSHRRAGSIFQWFPSLGLFSNKSPVEYLAAGALAEALPVITVRKPGRCNHSNCIYTLFESSLVS